MATLFKHRVVTLAATLATAASLSLCAAALAQYPDRPILLIASAAPGGTTDFAARLIAQPLAEALGQSVVVDNRPRAAGGVAAQAVKRAEPDGYTMMLQYSGFQVITPTIQPNAGWDPIADFAPVANILSAPQIVVVRPDSPITSMKELVAFAKANPGKLNYASSGNGSMQHVATELLNQQAGIKITHIPYKGTGPAMHDLLGGAVDMTITTPAPLIPHIKAGKLRALAVTGDKRLPCLPDVPTVAEAGFPDLIVSSWFAIYAPAKTPKSVIDKLASAVEKIMATPEFKRKAEDQGAEADFKGPQALAAYTKEELDRWAKVVKAGNITAGN